MKTETNEAIAFAEWIVRDNWDYSTSEIAKGNVFWFTYPNTHEKKTTA